MLNLGRCGRCTVVHVRCTDHVPRSCLQFKVTSVPLSDLDAPFELAEDGLAPVSFAMSPVNAPQPDALLTRARSTLQHRAQGTAEEATAPRQAGRAANWLGLTGMQVRTLVSAQKATG